MNPGYCNDLICGFLSQFQPKCIVIINNFFVRRIGRPILSQLLSIQLHYFADTPYYVSSTASRHFYFFFAPYYIFVLHFFPPITFLTHTYTFWSHFILSSSNFFFFLTHTILHMSITFSYPPFFLPQTLFQFPFFPR